MDIYLNHETLRCKLEARAKTIASQLGVIYFPCLRALIQAMVVVNFREHRIASRPTIVLLSRPFIRPIKLFVNQDRAR